MLLLLLVSFKSTSGGINVRKKSKCWQFNSCKGCKSAVEKTFELQAKAMEEIGRGITELRSLSNQQIVERVSRWQNAPNVHQLTCGNDSSHFLKPKETGWIWKRVILVCPDCDYVQNWIPEVVLLAKL